VARTYHWSIDDIMKLYLDDEDVYGLIFWYNDALEMEKEIKTPKSGKK